MATQLEIYNRALSLIGGQLLPALSIGNPVNTREALCEMWYPSALEVPAKEAMWSFLTRRAVIPASGEAEWGDLNTFPLPNGALHIHRVFRDPKYNTKLQAEDWSVEGDNILAPINTAYVIYSSLSPVEELPEYFIEAVVRLLASYIAMPLTENQRLVAMMAVAYDEFLQKAIAIDGKQARREKTTTGSLILNRRR